MPIGIREYTGLKDGEWVEVMVLNATHPLSYIKRKTKEWKDDMEKAEALGSHADPINLSFKEGGLQLDMAVIARGEDSDEPHIKVIQYGIGDVKLPGFRCTTNMTQFTLPEVYERSEELRRQGKSYGYNFQRRGITRVQVNGNGSGSPVFGYLHANPNPEKDWESGVHAYQVDWEDEKYKGLADKERRRQEFWKDDLAAWSKLTEDGAKLELLEGLARRIGLYKIVDRTVVYLLPEPGTTFVCRIKVLDKGYLDLTTSELENKKYTLLTKDIRMPIHSDDSDVANEILMALEHDRMLGRAKKDAESIVPVAPEETDEKLPF